MTGLMVVLAAALTLAAAPATAAAETKPERAADEKLDRAAAAQGRIIYVRYCASCHGAEARGDGPIAEDLRVPPSDLTALAKAHKGRFPFDKVAESIDGRKLVRGHGTPDMPVWGEVFPKTAGTESPTVATAVGRITHYLWSIQR